MPGRSGTEPGIRAGRGLRRAGCCVQPEAAGRLGPGEAPTPALAWSEATAPSQGPAHLWQTVASWPAGSSCGQGPSHGDHGGPTPTHTSFLQPSCPAVPGTGSRWPPGRSPAVVLNSFPSPGPHFLLHGGTGHPSPGMHGLCGQRAPRSCSDKVAPSVHGSCCHSPFGGQGQGEGSGLPGCQPREPSGSALVREEQAPASMGCVLPTARTEAVAIGLGLPCPLFQHGLPCNLEGSVFLPGVATARVPGRHGCPAPHPTLRATCPAPERPGHSSCRHR